MCLCEQWLSCVRGGIYLCHGSRLCKLTCVTDWLFCGYVFRKDVVGLLLIGMFC